MHGATYPLPSASTLGVRSAPDDSDQETAQGRQKQKRRRQALSCTECKRRKIKCDRANPCGPCVRRGEQSKCKWHIIEPMEKYVTRAEFDELMARFLGLEALVLRGAHSGHPPPHLASGSGSASASSPPNHVRHASPRPSTSASMSALMPLTSAGPPPEPVQGTAITPYHQAYGGTGAGPSSYMRPPSPRSPVREREREQFHRTSMSGPASASGTTRSPTIAYRTLPPAGPSGSGSSRPGPSASPRSPHHLPHVHALPPPHAHHHPHPHPHPHSHSHSLSSASPRSPPTQALSPRLSTLRGGAGLEPPPPPSAFSMQAHHARRLSDSDAAYASSLAHSPPPSSDGSSPGRGDGDGARPGPGAGA
ncbi:uncharacterized protein BXZ73DRAFT_101608 [Epithele typhae]|uniref:uncharacterized protein n=1 Tax=Epithele typhae TaxID=378194 RepID=UPI002007ED99|nr:uncharacterized protein BXZ73DRAFT_101608 [Epithele typhae]KAH9931698.1 hypothetical protein BXZ73DRAFT_101608 [Epithele typhae]